MKVFPRGRSELACLPRFTECFQSRFVYLGLSREYVATFAALPETLDTGRVDAVIIAARNFYPFFFSPQNVIFCVIRLKRSPDVTFAVSPQIKKKPFGLAYLADGERALSINNLKKMISGHAIRLRGFPSRDLRRGTSMQLLLSPVPSHGGHSQNSERLELATDVSPRMIILSLLTGERGKDQLIKRGVRGPGRDKITVKTRENQWVKFRGRVIVPFDPRSTTLGIDEVMATF